jgi:5,10-methylenetetrahydrofolate reductase
MNIETGITVPVIPGIMPLQTYASFLRLTKLTGTTVPASLTQALEPIKAGFLLRYRMTSVIKFHCVFAG